MQRTVLVFPRNLCKTKELLTRTFHIVLLATIYYFVHSMKLYTRLTIKVDVQKRSKKHNLYG
jgi:hypothetical protein